MIKVGKGRSQIHSALRGKSIQFGAIYGDTRIETYWTYDYPLVSMVWKNLVIIARYMKACSSRWKES